MSIMFEHTFIEFTLAALFQYLGKKVSTTPKDSAPVDFIYEDDDGKVVAIEVKSGRIDLSRLKQLVENVKLRKDKVDKFILITPESPKQADIEHFSTLIKGNIPEFNWYSFEEYTKLLTGAKVLSPKDINNLQIAAVTSNIGKYDKSHIGTKPTNKTKAQELLELIASLDKGENDFIPETVNLRRQFHYSVLADFNKSKKEMNDYFGIGRVSRDTIIVLSDIKDFSKIVSSAYPDDLNDAMNKYYRTARDLVFEHGGVLDKFIGDAVLAIFNYPRKNDKATVNAIRFSIALIELGKTVLNNLALNMDQAIPTGTRVGIATGDVYAINIGEKELEVSFVGDKINLAARLEKNADVNGILLSNITRTKISRTDNSFLEKLSLQEKKISPDKAKGQQTDIEAWLIEPNTVNSLSNGS